MHFTVLCQRYNVKSCCFFFSSSLFVCNLFVALNFFFPLLNPLTVETLATFKHIEPNRERCNNNKKIDREINICIRERDLVNYMEWTQVASHEAAQKINENEYKKEYSMRLIKTWCIEDYTITFHSWKEKVSVLSLSLYLNRMTFCCGCCLYRIFYLF